MTTTASTTTPAGRFYARPSARDSLCEHIAKINKRLAAVQSEQEPLTADFSTRMIESRDGEFFEVLVIDLSWEIAAAGWTLAGVVTPTEDRSGFTYTGLTLDREDVEITDMQWCDHCRTRRNRARVYIITSEQGARMQVGSTCLTPHTGLRATSGALNLLAMDPQSLLGEGVTSEEPFSEERLIGLGATSVWDTADLLARAIAVHPAWQERSARDSALNLADYLEKYGLRASTATDEEQAGPKRREQIALIRAHAAEQAPESDYWANAAVALGSEYTGRRHRRLVISTVSSWFRAQTKAQEVAREKAQTVQEAWAPEGTKFKASPVEVTLHRKASYETAFTYYGELNYVYTFRTDAGHLLVWKTQKGLVGHEGAVLEPGSRVRLIGGSVKAADEYRGDVQTPIVRVKYEVISAVEESAA